MLLLLAAGLELPLLLTSRVHVGRLVPVLPLLLLLVGQGWALAAGAIAGWLARRRPTTAGRAGVSRAVAAALTAALLIAVAWSTWVDYRTPPPPSREERTAAALAEQVAEAGRRGGAALVADPALGPEIEAIHAAVYRLALDDRYRFVDLSRDDAAAVPPDDERPPLYVVGLLDRLRAGDLPNLCRNLYLVAPEAEEKFLAVLGPERTPDGCTAPLRYEVLAA